MSLIFTIDEDKLLKNNITKYAAYYLLYLKDEKKKELEKDEIRKREYTKKKGMVSLQNIMKTRRETKPFI